MISALPSIAEAVAQIRRGELTPIALVEFCLDRIRRYEPQLRAWVRVDEAGARHEAERLGELARANHIVGPLHGIPIGIKDIIDVCGWPTQAGSRLRESHIAPADAPVVALLRKAGAIILGKTVTTEFASFDPPPTRNPWNLQRTPGGSSSGSAAAVAVGMCIAALGSQTGGSIIRPASYCGVVGMKPTWGRINTQGVVPLAPRLDHVGALARTVADVSQVLAVIDSQVVDVSEPIATTAAPPLCILEGFFFEQANAAVLGVVHNAIRRLAAVWPQIPPVQLPKSFGDVHVMHRRIMAAEAANYHRADFTARRDQFGPCIAALIAEGLALSAVDYLAATEHQSQFQADLDRLGSNEFVLVMPATSTTAPPFDTTGDPIFNSPWSYAGWPAITIPCGLSADGLPCGLQFVGPRGGDTAVLRAAALAERQLRFDDQPKLLLSPGINRH